MQRIAGLDIKECGKRDWSVYSDGAYLGTITEMEAVEGPPFYVTSVESFDAPAHKTLHSAFNVFTALI